MAKTIYKITPAEEWARAEASGIYEGAPVDHADGYIHFSTAAQVVETAARHFAGLNGLVLIAVDAHALGTNLKFEPSRDEDLFPHLYGPLPLSAVRWAQPLVLGEDGRHVFPELQT